MSLLSQSSAACRRVSSETGKQVAAESSLESFTTDQPRQSAARTAVCHVCGSNRIAPFMTVSDNGHLRRQDVKLPVYHCRDCDVFFLNPPPPASVGREYFAQAYAGTAAAGNIYYDDGFKERTSRLRLEMLTRYGARGKQLLDIGCGKGMFVHVATQSGWDAWGTEFDAGACAYAATHFGLRTIINGDLDAPALPAQFDVITLWDVIEHVPDPVGIFRQVERRLRPGGIVAARTGNIRSWAFDRHREGWWAFGSDHRFYFSPRSLSAAMSAAGLEVLDVVNGELNERPDKRQSRDISDTSLADGLRSMTRAPAKAMKIGRYGRNLLRRKLGERRYGEHYHTSIMTVLGRKPEHST
jgi:2-polyprenyl-3-methyl-5-hydroxy-6-metoxy-1,4-benzoquinol methylase